MTRIERRLMPSTAACCVCDHALSMQELEEFRSVADEELQDTVHCTSCRDEHLLLCRECSGRYTVDGLCGECASREYGLAG
jgi:hypothetical protein